MINTILFDLDGTLLPLEQDNFVKDYFYLLKKYFHNIGENSDEIIKTVIQATEIMLNNDGQDFNEMVFAKSFTNISKLDYFSLEPKFMNFYETVFDELKVHAGFNPLARKIVSNLKQKGYLIILATNPLFPRIATHKRIAWAGLNPDDFSLITTFEVSSYCKPKLGYYQEILDFFGKTPEEAIMIGNDVEEDMIVQNLNMDTFLLTNNIININNKDINNYKHGNFEDLYNFINTIENHTRQE